MVTLDSQGHASYDEDDLRLACSASQAFNFHPCNSYEGYQIGTHCVRRRGRGRETRKSEESWACDLQRFCMCKMNQLL